MEQTNKWDTCPAHTTFFNLFDIDLLKNAPFPGKAIKCVDVRVKREYKHLWKEAPVILSIADIDTCYDSCLVIIPFSSVSETKKYLQDLYFDERFDYEFKAQCGEVEVIDIADKHCILWTNDNGCQFRYQYFSIIENGQKINLNIKEIDDKEAFEKYYAAKMDEYTNYQKECELQYMEEMER